VGTVALGLKHAFGSIAELSQRGQTGGQLAKRLRSKPLPQKARQPADVVVESVAEDREGLIALELPG
jgi:hypothetical protein